MKHAETEQAIDMYFKKAAVKLGFVNVVWLTTAKFFTYG
jgi:hypothetical protein